MLTLNLKSGPGTTSPEDEALESVPDHVAGADVSVTTPSPTVQAVVTTVEVLPPVVIATEDASALNTILKPVKSDVLDDPPCVTVPKI